MKLELAKLEVKDLVFGEKTSFDSGTLSICKEELLEAIGGDDTIKSIELDIAKPGESVRIIPVKDVIEPRVKLDSEAEIFPGILGKVQTVGEGKTLALSGMAVVTTGKIVGFQEGIIDMCGEGAKYTPFSKLLNLVITADPVADLPQHKHEKAVRMIGLKAAKYIGEAVKDVVPNSSEVFETKPILEQVQEYPDLPKVLYVYMLQTQGLLHDTYVYGVDAKEIVPTFLYPTEIMDGAIVSGNCVSACDKNPTYVHLNNGVIQELYKEHGKTINFLGVVITNENVTLKDKQRSSDMSAKLCKFLGAEAAIISQEGFGNPDTDLMMNCKKIEDLGIKTVLVTDEYAGRDGASQSLADATPKADAVVTGGNANEVVRLAPVDKIIGHVESADHIAGGFNGSLQEDGTIEVEIQAITGATNETGFANLSAKTL